MIELPQWTSLTPYLCSSSRRAMIRSSSPRSSLSTACRIWAGLWGWLQGEPSPPSVWQYCRIRACSSSLREASADECRVMSEEPKHLVPVSQFNSPSVQLGRDEHLNDEQRKKNNYGNLLWQVIMFGNNLERMLGDCHVTQDCSMRAERGNYRSSVLSPLSCLFKLVVLSLIEHI